LRISKTSSAGLVISVVALIFAVWPLIFPTKGEAISPYITYNFESRELSLEEQVMELQCWMVNYHQRDRMQPAYPQKHKTQMKCQDLNVFLVEEGKNPED